MSKKKKKILPRKPSQTMAELALGILRDQMEGKKYMGLPLTRKPAKKRSKK